MPEIADYKLKQGNTLPKVRANLLDGYGNYLDLSGSSVMFNLRTPGQDPPVVSAAATILDYPTALAEYAWSGGDTDSLSGWYQGEFVVTYAGGSELTVPNDGYISVAITRRSDVAAGLVPRLRRMVADRLPVGGDDTDAFWTDSDLQDLLSWNADDLNLAALAGWVEKAGYYVEMITTVESGSERRLSDLSRNAERMVKWFSEVSGTSVTRITPRPVAVTASILAQNAEYGVGPIAAPVTPEMFSVPSRMSLPGS